MRLARYVKPGESSDGDGDEGDEEEGYDCQLLDSVEHEPVSINVECTTQGAALLAVAQWSDSEYASKHGTAQATGRLINGLGLFAISSVLQTILVLLVLFFSDERMMDPYQFETTHEMAATLRKARYSNTTLPKNDPVFGLCMRDHSVPYSQSIVVFLWLCKNSPDVLHSLWTIFVLAGMPKAASFAIEFKEGTMHICRLPSISKWMFILFVKIPSIAIQLTLTVTGLAFLMYCHALGLLILKAISLAYIATVPSIVFAGLASKPFFAEVSKAKLTGVFMRSSFFDAWVSGIGKIILHVGLAFWYCRILHAGLTDFRWECFFYKYKFVFPNCGHCGAQYFGLHLAN